MTVSDEVISDFAKAVVRKDPEPEFITVNGIARKYDDEWMIELDGSQQLTPIASSAVGLNDGDRVTAQIKNHSLSVTGNLTGKTTTQQDTIAIKKEIDDRLDEHDSKITEVEDLMATKVNTDELNAQKGRIDQLVSDNATIREKLTATDASIDKLDADVVDINDSLTAKQADIDSLKTSKIDATVADAKYATIGDLDAANASINNLDANYADFKKTTTDSLDAVDANIKKLNTDKLNVTDAAAKYANIDFANIGEAAIKAFYAKSGVISDVVISDGHVTGKLVGVTIKGDLIEGGTVVADKLVMLGEDGLYYKLNTNGKTVSSEQTEYNSLNGSIITAKSITAEKVNVNDLVAFGATIGGLHISNGSLYSGAKNAVSNTTNGVYMDSQGQFALGNASNFLKFYKDGSGKWKLVISADAMTLGTGGSVEDAINESAKTVTLQYYRSTSATSLVGGSWADSSPEWVDGTYIWTRSKSVDRAGNATYSEPACITGNTGATGPQGKQGTPGIKGADGTNGTDGVGISSVTITYGVSSSSSTHPTSWQTTVPNVPQGQYLWTRTITDYTSDSVPDTVTYTYALQGKDGAKGATGSPGAKGDPGKDGAPGTSVKVSSIQYQVGSSGTTPPTGTWSSSVLATSTGQFLWTKTTFSDGNVAYGVAAHGAKGDRGATGEKGATGATGNGISSVTVTYGVSSSASAQPSSWQTTVPTVPQGQYLWTRTVTDYTDPSAADTVTYTYALQGKDGAKGATGNTGATGAPGKDGTSVKVSSIQYQVGTSPTTAPTGTWSNSVLATSVGQYLWTKTTFSDGNVAYGVAAHGSTGPQGAKGADGKSPTVSVSKSGTTTTITVHNVDGSTSTQTVKDGTNGTPGAKGADGRTQYLHVKYSNDNGATFTSNSGETVGSYIGTCTDFNEADPTSVSAYKWARIKGDTGATGATGNGISSVTVTYGVSASASAQPSSWQTTIPTVPQGQYLWTRTVTDYTDPSVADTVTYTYSLQGKDGAKGATGSPGKDGTSVTVSSIQYQVGTSPTTAPTGTWSNSVLATSAGQYLWTKTTFSDGKVAYGVAAHGSTGPQGPKGTDGKSPTVSVSKSGTVTTITVHNADGSTTTQKVNDGTNGTPGTKGADGKTTYLHVKYSNDNGATFTANSGETVGTYIGTCTDFNSADPTTVSSYKWARIKGDTGAKGDPGAKGETGATGVGVSGTTVTYQSSSSGTAIPTGTWSSTIPSVPEGSFLWTRIVYSYSNGTSTTAYSVGKMGAKGAKGDPGAKGATGATGAPGAAGRGIKSSNVTYQAGNSQTSIPTGPWATSVPKLSSATPYLWTRTILTYTDNTSTTAYSVGTTLDGVNVGGRNLISNKIDNWQSGNWDVINGTYTAYDGRICTKSGIAVSPNAVYYIGLFLNGLGGKHVLVRTYDNTGAYNGSYVDIGNKIFVVPDNVYEIRFVIYEQVTLNNISEGSIRIKLELGNIATDWTPAPEDVATDIADAANTAANALEKANNNEKNITEATKAILNIQENIKALVTGPNGSSLMTQTNKGWTFDMSSIERTLNEATDDITNLNSDLSATNDILNSTKKLLDDVTKKTAYINFATDDSGNPCIELGKQDNPFKLRITNTSIDFMQGSQKIAYLTNHQLYIESSVITDSILIGQNGTFIWKKRANNHLGLRYT